MNFIIITMLRFENYLEILRKPHKHKTSIADFSEKNIRQVAFSQPTVE